MKITVKQGKEVWASPDGKVKIYDITLDNGTVMQTKSGKIAEGGEFDVETYTNDKGKTYVRQLAKEQSHFSKDKQFKADPDSRESIEWQTSLKAAVEVTRDYYIGQEMPKTLEDYAKEVDKVAVHFKNLINTKPTSVVDHQEEEVAEEVVIEDQPPIESYEVPF